MSGDSVNLLNQMQKQLLSKDEIIAKLTEDAAQLNQLYQTEN